LNSSWLTACVVAPVAFLWISEGSADEPREVSPRTADPMRGKDPGEVRDDNGLKLKLVWCPPGFFNMGEVQQIEKPARQDADGADEKSGDSEDAAASPPGDKIGTVRVLVTRGYWLGKCEVTQAEWKQIMGTEPWKNKKFIKEGNAFPATHVRWDDVMEFCRRLTKQEREAGRLPEGWNYTLPSEAEWERACRARTETTWSFGNDESKMDQYAWFRDSIEIGEFARPAGRKKPNPWGLHDMHGNVWEWCRDWYTDKLPGGRDPETKDEGRFRVVRGGAWRDIAVHCQSGSRYHFPSDGHDYDLGFRVALMPVRKAN